jgi:hypothetical protein
VFDIGRREFITLLGGAVVFAARFWHQLKRPPRKVFLLAHSLWWSRSPPVARAMSPGVLLRKA